MHIWDKFLQWKKDKQQKRLESSLDETEQENGSRAEEQYLINRSNVKLEDSCERERYISSLLEQMADASIQLQSCNEEYKTVDLYLKDMEEIEYISGEEKQKLVEYARSISELEMEQSKFEEKQKKLSDTEFARMEKLGDDTDEGVKKMRETEEYQQAIRNDLKRLESEKQACLFRRQEADLSMENLRGMVIICTAAVFLCMGILLFMQFALEMNAQVGYLLTAAVAAIALTAMYMKYLDASAEKVRASRSLNKIILLQNRVKIRYVNNTNLLEYYYLKFGISSSNELNSLWERFQVEKAQREKQKEARKDLTYSQKQFIKILRMHRLYDPMIWLHQTGAILDPKEMVEVRHALILRRQKLRKQITFNTDNASAAQNEIKDLVADFPQYAKEILKMISDFEDQNSISSL